MAAVAERTAELPVVHAEFRPGQLEAILTVAEERGRILLVQRTGWGKSAVYFIATRLLRDKEAGPHLVLGILFRSRFRRDRR